MSEEHTTHHWPTEIRVDRAARLVEIAFDTGARFSLPAELLRVESPSAEVQGHGGDVKITVPGKRGVGILGVERVGNYAIRIRFDDGHDTGLFSWRYLYELGANEAQVWADYLARLEAEGLSRDPQGGP